MKTSPFLALSLALAALASGCASPAVPQPPSLRLSRVVDNLTAARKGRRVTLSWSPSTETTDRQSVHWPTATRVCRVVNQFPIATCAHVVAEISNAELASSQPSGRHTLVSFEDALPPELLDSQAQATYAVEIVNPRGRSAGLSNQVRVSLAATEPAPSAFQATLDAEGPRLVWNVTSLLPAAPSSARRVRVYRRASSRPEPVLIAEELLRLGEGEARDRNFSWESTYDYWGTVVTVLAPTGRPAVEVEGEDSPIVRLVAHDTFPPASPAGLEAVFSSVGQKPFIDLTWIPNSESDVAGYLVYRRHSGSDFTLVTPAPVKAPAWRDPQVSPAQHYEYAVRAVDLRGNQSPLSLPASEQTPADAPASQEEK